MRCQCKKKVTTFYWYFRPIALSAKLFGVLPLQNLHYANGSKIYFHYFSVANFYSTVVFITVLALFYYFSKFQFVTLEIQIGLIWKIIVAHVIILRSIISFLFCVHHSKKLPSLIKMLVLFDKMKCCMLKTDDESRIKKFFIRAVVPLFHGIFYMALSFIELNLFVRQILPVENTDHKKAAIIFGILGDWQILPLLLYVYFAFIIKVNFQDINRTITSYVSLKKIDNEKIEYDPNFAKILENIRCLHTLMSAAVNQLSNSYGSFMAIDQLCINLMFVVNLYVYFFTAADDCHLLFCTIINAILVLAVIMVSHHVKEFALGVLEPLQSIRLSALDEASQKEVQLFMSQLAAAPIEISAAGYFVMDRNQIPSIISSVATYFIVLVQFATEIQRNSPNNSTRAKLI